MTNRIDALKTLLTRLIDSREGYSEVLEQLDSPAIKSMAERFMAHRDRHAAEIRGVLERAGQSVDDDGSLLASAHRVFVSLRDAVSSGDEAVLTETIRGEQKLLEAYDEAIAADSGDDPEYHMLVKQYGELKTEIDQLEVRKDIAAE